MLRLEVWFQGTFIVAMSFKEAYEEARVAMHCFLTAVGSQVGTQEDVLLLTAVMQ